MVAVKVIKAEDSMVRKYNKKTFFNKNIPQLKKNTASKKSISRKLFLYNFQVEGYLK